MAGFIGLRNIDFLVFVGVRFFVGTFGVGVGGLAGFGDSVCGVGGWCCASVLSICGVGWIGSGCELVYGVFCMVVVLFGLGLGWV